MGFERIDPPADLRAFILAVVDEFREVEKFGSSVHGRKELHRSVQIGT